MAVNKKLALDRINQLFEQMIVEPEYADRYVELARKIAMKAQISIPKEHKRKYCHNCYSYIIFGKTGIVRISNKTQIITCNKCKHVARYPL